MKFSELYEKLDLSQSTNNKRLSVRYYLEQTPPKEAVYGLALLMGRKFSRPIKRADIKHWAMEFACIPEWLFDESYHAAGDFAEALALIIHPPSTDHQLDLEDFITRALPRLSTLSKEKQKDEFFQLWQTLSKTDVLILIKILTGGLRVGVSKKLALQALEDLTKIPSPELARLFMGEWPIEAAFLESLLEGRLVETQIAQAYPFLLAHPLENSPQALGPVTDWQIEWKWDGIRLQGIRRFGEAFLWSRGEEILNESFPEIVRVMKILDQDCVIDGEVIAIDANGQPAPFTQLQKRLGRRKVSKKLESELPVRFVAYDLLEIEGVDCRDLALIARREKLEKLLKRQSSIDLSPALNFSSWSEAEKLRSLSRKYQAEGFMIKSKSSSYVMGRKRGHWWKWKVDPLTVDAVLLYAQAGHGRRSGLFTDYTFAVWEQDTLVPIAKAYSGLSDQEIQELDRWIKKNTKDRFGPVRSVHAEHVFELAFEGINPSPRHKSGVALRFPRIKRWRKDKTVDQANELSDLKEFLVL